MQKKLITFDQLTGLVGELCRQIANDNWRPDYIVGISRGGLMPAVMISHYFGIPMRPLQVSLRDHGDCVSDLSMGEDAFEGKKILVVDDINDQGSTINWIKQDWPSGCFPNNTAWSTVWGNTVRFAVLIDNLASAAEIKVSYAGEEINKAENNVWVDFPYESWWTK